MTQRGDEDRDTGLDPVALTLAIWLGLLAGGTMLERVAEDAVAQAASEPARAPIVAAPSAPAGPLDPMMAPFTG